MIDVAKIDDEIRYPDFEPKGKFGDFGWLVALLLAPYIVALVVLLVGAVLQAIG
ncbi:MAG: hypothetical protein WA628_26480 [Terriglobales bacterium]